MNVLLDKLYGVNVLLDKLYCKNVLQNVLYCINALQDTLYCKIHSIKSCNTQDALYCMNVLQDALYCINKACIEITNPKYFTCLDDFTFKTYIFIFRDIYCHGKKRTFLNLNSIVNIFFFRFNFLYLSFEQ